MNFNKSVKRLWRFFTASDNIEQLPDAVLLTDFKGNIKYYNKKSEEIFVLNDYEDEESVINLNELIEDAMQCVKISLVNIKPVLVTVKTPGRKFYAEMNVSKKKNGFCITVRDLTRLTNEIMNEEKILKFNSEKNAMLAKLEEDIKSPINSINGFSQGLLDGLGGSLNEKQAKYINIIKTNSNELYAFLDTLLEFSKVESSVYEPDIRNFDVVECLKTVARDCEDVINAKKLLFDIDYLKLEKRNVCTDMTTVKNSFKNILENSVAMTENGYITVKLAHPDEQACALCNMNISQKKYTSFLHIKIKDTGAIVPDEEMKYLCDPYAQLENGKKHLLRALKLGTASILIKRSGGAISIRSDGSRGMIYNVILPMDKE